MAAAVGIILIDLVLSGDNAVVIGMAAHRLPHRQRRLAIMAGAGLAIGLRVVLTALATVLLQLSWIRLIGGGLLLGIGFKLLKEEEETHTGVAGSEGIVEAISTIVVADVVMSVDNILGVAAAAHGNLPLLLFGLILSMAIMMFGGNLISSLLDRLWWLVYVGSAVIIWTGTDMMFRDSVVESRLGEPTATTYVIMAAISVLVLTAAHVVHRRRSPGRRDPAETGSD